MATGIVWHEGYARTPAPVLAAGQGPAGYQAELAQAATQIHSLAKESGLGAQLSTVDPVLAEDSDILRFHRVEYVERVKQLSRSGGRIGAQFQCPPGGYEAALLGAGGVMAAVDAVATAQVENAYALVCPPGHHALAHEGQEYCIFGNAVIAARHAMHVHGMAKIAFVDWDLRHGNGTEAAFWDDPSGLTISIHQDRCYPPDRGLVHQWGEGRGDGYNINIPLPPGSGVGAYIAAYEQVVIPALYAYRPDLIIVPSGFGSGAFDPIGRNMMTSDGFRKLTLMLKHAARDLCGGRLVFCHEGGHSGPMGPFMGLAVLEELAGLRTEIRDPFLALAKDLGGQELQPHQQAIIEQSRQVLKRALLCS